MRLQFLRGGSGALAGIFFAAGLDKSLDGESHRVLTFIVLYGLALLLACLCAYSWVLIDRRKRAAASASPAQDRPEPPDIGPSADTGTATSAPLLLRAKGTNDGHFPRVESARDSLGHTAERTMNDSLYAFTEQVLRPGQQVRFELEATDPNGDDLELSVITPGQTETDADVAISGGVVTWTVRDDDIADPAHVHIYVTSRRSYHRHRLFDDGASFVYRVLPRL